MTRAHNYLDVFDYHINLVTTKKEWAALRRSLPMISRVSVVADSLGMTEVTAKGRKGTLLSGHVVIYIDVEAHLGDQYALLSTVAHECYHASGLIFDRIMGSSYDGNNEPIAFLIGWMTQWVWRNLC